MSRALCDNACMQSITLEEAQKHLPELVHNLAVEGDLLLLEAGRPVARLVRAEAFTDQDCAALATSLQGVGRKYLQPGADPIRDLITQRESEDLGRNSCL